MVSHEFARDYKLKGANYFYPQRPLPYDGRGIWEALYRFLYLQESIQFVEAQKDQINLQISMAASSQLSALPSGQTIQDGSTNVRMAEECIISSL